VVMGASKNPKGRSVGVREAKATFSRLVADARSGREWIITDRGTPVARLVPLSAEGRSLERRLADLEAAGALEPQAPGERRLPPPLAAPPGVLAAMLQEDRGT